MRVICLTFAALLATASASVLEVTVYVSLPNDARQPAKDVRVTLRNDRPVAFATTGETGRVVFDRPTARDLRVEAFRLSCPEVRREATIADHDLVEIVLPRTGTLEVTVLEDGSGGGTPIPGATVTVFEPGSLVKSASAASEDGIATTCLEAGREYRFRIEFPGFGTVEHPGIVIEPERTARFAVQLHEFNDRASSQE